jgi:hypothetical protein
MARTINNNLAAKHFTARILGIRNSIPTLTRRLKKIRPAVVQSGVRPVLKQHLKPTVAMMLKRPQGWLDSALCLTLERMHLNVVGTMATVPIANQMHLMNELFLHLKALGGDTHEEATYPFFIQSYSHWLAGVRCWATEQLQPCYELGRASLECTLYGNYLHHNDADLSIKQLYVDRKGQNNKPTLEFRQKFGISNLLNALPDSVNGLTKQMYEFSIEMGAHPNLLAVFAGRVPAENGVEHLVYIGADDDTMLVSALFVLSVGLCSVSTFGELMGCTDQQFRKQIDAVTMHIAAQTKDNRKS